MGAPGWKEPQDTVIRTEQEGQTHTGTVDAKPQGRG